jgi:endonuclease III
MTRAKKVLSDSQKKLLELRQAMEQCQADKAAAEEELGRLNFTLQLFLANRSPDEATTQALEAVRQRIDELEDLVRTLPRRIRELRHQQGRLRSSG